MLQEDDCVLYYRTWCFVNVTPGRQYGTSTGGTCLPSSISPPPIPTPPLNNQLLATPFVFNAIMPLF